MSTIEAEKTVQIASFEHFFQASMALQLLEQNGIKGSLSNVRVRKYCHSINLQSAVLS